MPSTPSSKPRRSLQSVTSPRSRAPDDCASESRACALAPSPAVNTPATSARHNITHQQRAPLRPKNPPKWAPRDGVLSVNRYENIQTVPKFLVKAIIMLIEAITKRQGDCRSYY